MRYSRGFTKQGVDTPNVHNGIRKIDELVGYADKAAEAQDKEIVDLRISAADSRNALTSASAEVSSRFIIRGWVRKLTASTAESLFVLRKSIDAISIAGGVAKEFYLKYRKTISNIRGVVIEEAQDWLAFTSSQLEKAEQKLRQDGGSPFERHVGIIRVMGGQKFIVTVEDLPYAIAGDELLLPVPGSVVEFDVGLDDGKPLARNVMQTSNFFILKGEVVKTEDALQPVRAQLEHIVASVDRNSVPLGWLNRKATRAGSLPTEFWKSFGYSSLGSFSSSCANIYTYPQSDDAEFVSAKPFMFRDATIESVKNWAVEFIRTADRPVNTGLLATEASAYFSNGAIPIRIQIEGVEKFSDIFKDDERFLLASNEVSLVDVR
ncbi:hypothetical protein [Pseudophaeobacter sp.]|uniref:hypothetical protein n=1 Tax=Pseudophaeobacter sp. TaxID=1971739 RepID=UPI00262C6E74|nr:hypothetical protein [Pseudophaeobacter sp.]